MAKLKPGDILFIEANGEEAAPGWYRVDRFDHDQTREHGPAWWWECTRLCDGLVQTIAEDSNYLLQDIEGTPAATAPRRRGARMKKGGG
jgi:hypothetical protein